ncbi:helix-turn-helix domain-containing protein [Terrimonas rubra]|uniref:Helix-turn-helix domain-containing protein n=1 Tax=Terrimonas rubra TaxID=1035890 RepID=A0ABW6A4Q7_9BACT
MKSVIIKPRTDILKQYIQYFLFFKKTDSDFLHYTTFPNSNLCLAIYKENNVNYITSKTGNSCIIKQGNTSFASKFYGFHKMPFSVDVNSPLDQICIIFHPSALRAFSGEKYNDLMLADNVSDIFSVADTAVFEKIFEESDFSKRAEIIEHLLVCNLKFEIPNKLKEALFFISKYNDDNLTVEALAKMLVISTPTLFRLFNNHLGQSPKAYLKTIRFRSALNEMLNRQHSLTSIAYLNQYYDQAHFINDFRLFSGCSPRQLCDKVSVRHNALAWIYNKK